MNLKKYIGKTLSTIHLGAHYAHPDSQFFEILSSASTLKYEEPSSELNLNFESNSKLLNIASQTIRTNEGWFFKLKATEIDYEQSDTRSCISLNRSKIKSFELYETDSADNTLNYNTEIYLPDAMKIILENGAKLILQCMMGEDEAEPALLVYYIDKDNFNTEIDLNTEKWKLKETIT